MDADVVVVVDDDVDVDVDVDGVDVDVDAAEDDKDGDWPLLAVLIHGCRSGYRLVSNLQRKLDVRHQPAQ